MPIGETLTVILITLLFLFSQRFPMLVRSITTLAALLIFNTCVVGQDYFSNGRNTRTVSRTSGMNYYQEDPAGVVKDVKETKEAKETDDEKVEEELPKDADKEKEEEKQATPTYFSIFEGLEPEEINLEAESVTRRLPVVIEETVKPGEKASKKKFEKLNYFAAYDKGFAIIPYNKRKPRLI